MGVIQAAPERENKGPELPEDMSYLYVHYRRLKFAIHRKDEALVLMPRGPLGFVDVQAYCQTTGADLQPWEVEVIMNLDGIFEGREHG